MNKIFKTTKDFYGELGKFTRLIIKISLVSYLSFVTGALFCHLNSFSAYHYELLLLTDSFLSAAKSVAGVGFFGALLFHYTEQ